MAPPDLLGDRCTIGEDRAFTNLILRQGYDTVYQRSAVVYTTVPETYKGMCRMFLRWDRSQFSGVLSSSSLSCSPVTGPKPPAAHRGLFSPGAGVSPHLLFIPLLLVSSSLSPCADVKFFTALALVSFILTVLLHQHERDMDFVYGVLYSFYAFLFRQMDQALRLSHLAGRPLVDSLTF